MLRLYTVLRKWLILPASIIFLIIGLNGYVLAHLALTAKTTDIFHVDTEFCLVNSTPTTLHINRVWSIDPADWTGNFQPDNLLNQTLLPASTACWPLTLVKRLSSDNQFNIEIKTDLGALTWKVKQYDAIGELHNKYATLSNDTNYYLLQKSGDNNGYATNVFILEEPVNTQDDYLSNWMKQIPNHYILKNIQLLGAHDAGVNREDGVICTTPPLLSVAQAWSLSTQLKHGIRYFDIRLEKGNDQRHYPFHKTWKFGCSSKKSFETSLSEIMDFIKHHESEAVFLKISHTDAPTAGVIKMLDTWTNSIDNGSYFYKSNLDNYNWTDKSIGELRGKIVLLLDCEYAHFLNPKNGYFSFSTASRNHCSADNDNKIIYDKYSNTLNFDDMRRDQLNKLTQHGKNKNQLFLLSWTLTGGDIIAHAPRPAAYLTILAREQFGKTLPLPNIIYYDFEDPGINKILVEAQKNLWVS